MSYWNKGIEQACHTITNQSIENNTVLEPLILYLYIALSIYVGSSLVSYYIEPLGLKRLLRLWLNRIDTKPVTCRKGPKVPFAVTRHIYIWFDYYLLMFFTYYFPKKYISLRYEYMVSVYKFPKIRWHLPPSNTQFTFVKVTFITYFHKINKLVHIYIYYKFTTHYFTNIS